MSPPVLNFPPARPVSTGISMTPGQLDPTQLKTASRPSTFFHGPPAEILLGLVSCATDREYIHTTSANSDWHKPLEHTFAFPSPIPHLVLANVFPPGCRFDTCDLRLLPPTLCPQLRLQLKLWTVWSLATGLIERMSYDIVP